MECCCKHATRCISVQKATGRISVIWLRLVTQFTLVLHEERKKKGKERKRNPRWKSRRRKPSGIKSVHLSRSLLNYASRIHVQIVWKWTAATWTVARLRTVALERNEMRCSAVLARLLGGVTHFNKTDVALLLYIYLSINTDRCQLWCGLTSRGSSSASPQLLVACFLSSTLGWWDSVTCSLSGERSVKSDQLK